MKLALALTLLFLAGTLEAQESIGIRVIGNVALIPVNTEGKTFSFLLDSGSEGSSIDPKVAAQLRLEPQSRRLIRKNFRDIMVDITELPNLNIGSFKFSHLTVSELDLAPITKAVGTDVDGILGTDILREITFKLNYSNQKIVIGPVSKIGIQGSPFILKRFHSQFLLQSKLMNKPVDLVLDTGSNSTDLSATTWSLLTQDWTPSRFVEGVQRAGNPTSSAILVCLPSIAIGPFTVSNQAVRAQRKSDAGAFSSEQFNGILGSDILRQFEITFDLGRDTVYLKPDTRYKRDPYRYTTIGIQIAKNTEGKFQIMSVWKDSPAEKAGLETGDVIKQINGESLNFQTLEHVSRQMHGKEGTKVELKTERAGTTSKLTIRTKSLLCN